MFVMSSNFFFSFVYCMHDHWFPQTLSARVMTLKYYILVPVHNPFFYLLKNRLFDTAGSPKKTFLAFLHYKIISFLAAWLITPRYLLLTVFGVDGVASIVDVNGPLSYTFLWPLESLWDAMTVWRGGSNKNDISSMHQCNAAFGFGLHFLEFRRGILSSDYFLFFYSNRKFSQKISKFISRKVCSIFFHLLHFFYRDFFDDFF